jgi:pimeloyl-ACP methyl ester carboxylesterase
MHSFIRSLILGTSPEGYISLCNVTSKAMKPNYGSIKVPLLILAGSEDKTAPLESSERILSEYGTEDAKKKISVLDGVGHWHCVGASDELTRVVYLLWRISHDDSRVFKDEFNTKISGLRLC